MSPVLGIIPETRGSTRKVTGNPRSFEQSKQARVFCYLPSSPIANINTEGHRAQEEILPPLLMQRGACLFYLSPPSSYTLFLPAGTGDWAQLAQSSGLQSLGRDSAFSLPWPPHQARQAFQRQGQRHPCYPTYFSRCEETSVCSESTLGNLGKGA